MASKNLKVPPVVSIALACVVAAGTGVALYLNRPAPRVAVESPSADATAYLKQLALSNVEMKAADNVMRQQVIYVTGQITNRGPRLIQRIDVYCIFDDVNGHEVHRERATVVGSGASLPTQQTRPFQMAFDSVPETWNQALPRLVIAQIRFGS